MRPNVLFPVAVLTLSFAVVGLAEEFRLKYRVVRELRQEVGYVAGHSCYLFHEKPPDMAHTPKLVSLQPWYGIVMAKRYLILDQSSRKATRHDVMWLDTNGDGKFGRKERFPLGSKRGSRTRAADVNVKFKVNDGWASRRYRFTHYGDHHLRVEPRGYVRGKVRFGDRTHLVAIVDWDANGSCTDPSETPYTGDRIFIDTNDNGGFDHDYGREQEAAYVGKYLHVNGAYWGLSLSSDGSRISISRAKPQTGQLDVDEPCAVVTVGGKNGKFRLARTSARKVFRLPVGDYRLEKVQVRRKYPKGVEWSLESRPGRGPSLHITAEETARLSIAAPLTVSVRPRSYRDKLYFHLRIEGEDGLRYQICREGKPPKPPQLILEAQDGSWTKRYAFSYHGPQNDVRSISLPESSIKKPFTATPELTTGPFKAKVETFNSDAKMRRRGPGP